MGSNEEQLKQDVEKIQQFARDVRPMMGNLKDVMGSLAKHLTPEQQQEFDKQGITQQFDEAMAKFDQVNDLLKKAKI